MRSGLLIFSLFLISFSYAQKKCGFVAPSTPEFENWISTKIVEERLEDHKIQTIVYQIPVVVHVFHQGEPVGVGVNLSEERIKAQIDSLTMDFRRMNADTINTPSEFLAVAADTEIEFVLAKQNPAGNPTNGIVRLQGSRDSYRMNLLSDRILIRSESYWSPKHYINIFVIESNSKESIGKSSLPRISLPGIYNDNLNYSFFDGIIIDYNYFGVNSFTPKFESYGRTLTHEVGHYLGLRHIWGDGKCSADDFVDDTPRADGNNDGYTSPCTFPNPEDFNVCVSGEPEMFQNYMDFTDDICMNLFTNGQKTRMRIVMDNAPNRTSLITSPGLIDPIRFSNDLAITHLLNLKDLEYNSKISPMVRLVNYGTNKVTSYDIQLLINESPVGNVQSVSTSLPPLSSDTITFANWLIISAPSIISFEISNVNGMTDGDLSNNIFSKKLSSTSSIDLPFKEDFENSLKILDSGGSSFPWEVVNAPKNSPSNKAYVFKSHQNTQWFGEKTIFKAPVFDLTNISSGDLFFSYAHANAPDAFYDGLMVKVSVDYGQTFPDVIFSSFGLKLATATKSDQYFTPANQLEWVDTVLSITKYRNIDGVQFAFVGINGSGNNIYVDDVSIVETTPFENDIKTISLKGPLITCSNKLKLSLRIRNVGSEIITSFKTRFSANSIILTRTFTRLSLSSKEFETFTFDVMNLSKNENTATVEILSVNGVSDQSTIDNTIQATIKRDTKQDEYPLTLNFENPDSWNIVADGSKSLWERVKIEGNGLLKVNGFNSSELNKTSWFISPQLNTGGLDSAILEFMVSYAKRVNFDDRLQVLLSVNCGDSYPITLSDADSDSLSVMLTSDQWLPSGSSDWKKFTLDISTSIPFKDNIRIAFAFTSRGGNDLFIDDIQIRGNEAPSFKDMFRIFPNPSTSKFNVGFNLPSKEPVIIMIMDVSGRVVFQDQIRNAFNQIIEYKAPSQEGLYFLTAVGSQFKLTQKLFISR